MGLIRGFIPDLHLKSRAQAVYKIGEVKK